MRGLLDVKLLRSGALALVIALTASVLTGFSVTAPAQAADGSAFVDGNIISDAVFFNGSSMTSAEVQSFLVAKGGTCQSGFTCLPGYTEITTSIPANPMCAAYAGGSSESAATIIAKVGVACGISQKTILATLEKEQGLVTATAPSGSRYASAMGALCPDTAPCDAAASGFFRQVYTGAYLFKRYTQPPGTGPGTDYSSRFDLMYPVGQTSSILYQIAERPQCGSKSVYVQNQATHALYVYTPYTPNAAALANMSGVGDECSAYGNRNFWRNFTDWFGSTQYEASEQAGVYALNSAGSLLLYRGTGSGSWALPVQVGNGWGSMSSVAALGDFNRDGKRDVAAMDQSGQIWLYPTDGSTGWGTPVSIDSGWDSRSTLFSAGDFDENGTIDVFVRDQLGDLWLVRGNGSTGVTNKSKVGSGWSGFDQLTGGLDWNGDGHTDVIARSAGGDLFAYFGTGAGGWSSSARIGNGWRAFAWVSAAGDFDADGAQDLVAATTDGRLFLYAGNGRGGWKASTQVGTGWTGMRAVFGFGPTPALLKAMQPGLGDINSDGARDVLAWGIVPANGRYSGRALYSRTPSGTLNVTTYTSGAWQSTSTIGSGWGNMVQVLGVGDVSLDGLPDLLALDAGGTLWSYPTDGVLVTGSPTSQSTGWATTTMLIDAGDFTGDGLQDLMSRDANGDLWLSSGQTAGGLSTRAKIGNGWNIFDTILGAGDWDGDSKPDLLARTPAGALFMYLGNGSGGWKASKQIGVGWNVLSQLTVVGDWNGDGNPDLVGRTSDGNVLVYRSNGTGGWSGVTDTGAGLSSAMLSGSGALGPATTQFSAYFGSGQSAWKGNSAFSGGSGIGQNVVSAGDTNGDGKKELVWRDASGNLVSQNYSGSGLTDAPVIRASGASALNLLVGVGDFNGDGLSDIAGRDASGVLWLYRGSTGTPFLSRVQIGVGWSGMSSIVGVGDFNGDAKTDVVGITRAGDMYLYFGNGPSGFNGSVLIGNGWSGMDVVFSPGDFNGDGKSDILARQRTGGGLYLFSGNGAGAFAGGARQVGSGWNIFTGIG